MDIWAEIQNTAPPAGEVGLFWLGQAGFLLKNAAGQSLVIDPYLSDCGYRMKDYNPAFKRLSATVVAPEELFADVYLATHHHFDHFDYDTVPVVAKRSDVQFLGPQSCQELFSEAGVPKERRHLLNAGMSYARKGITVTATKADHGDMAPDAIGAVVEMDGVRVWFSGDTAFRPDLFAEVKALWPDVAVVCINGAFGNMNAEEGARAAHEVGARLAVPCHFWTFTQHGGEPWLFGPAFTRLCSGCTPAYMRQGEGIFIAKAGRD